MIPADQLFGRGDDHAPDPKPEVRTLTVRILLARPRRVAGRDHGLKLAIVQRERVRWRERSGHKLSGPRALP